MSKRKEMKYFITLYISKNFETLDKNILLIELIKKQTLTYLKQFLEIIFKIYKKINLNINKEMIHPESGVQKGLYFRHILFIIYINYQSNTQ